MPDWVRVTSVAEAPPGSVQEVHAQGRVVALFNVEGDFFAVDGICPHQGGPLGDGQLEGATVTCPWHGWQFNVRDGKSLLNPQIEQEAFQVRVDDGEVFLYV